MKLTAYPVMEDPPPLRPAPHTRDWMDASSGGFAYRCLPLANANSHGWEMLCPADCTIIWTGGHEPRHVVVDTDPPGGDWVMGHFGEGIVTFSIGYVFRTEPGINLWVGGPVNRPMDGIMPLTGLVETDWMPSTFTMNWKITRARHEIRFRKGEPFCSIFPLARGVVADVAPEIAELDSDPDFKAQFTKWSEDRSAFLEDLKVQDSQAQQRGWQKDYFRGRMPDGDRTSATHETKIRPRPFADRNKTGK